MKLVFFSGEDETKNRALLSHLITLSPVKNPLIGLIPANSMGCELEFSHFVNQFSHLTWHRFLLYPIDRPTDQILFQQLQMADIIHLGGGNTFYFLSHLRRSKMLHFLRQFVQRGGILTGVSAGAILMTPSIYTASFPDSDCDENWIAINNWQALNLVPFEFYPHYKNSARYNEALLKYSRQSKYPIYACADGAGIVYDQDQITFHGKCVVFSRNQKFSIP